VAFLNFLYKPKNELEKGGRSAAPVVAALEEPERTCPNCRATIKLPRKKGKHTCTCPKCRVDFKVKV